MTEQNDRAREPVDNRAGERSREVAGLTSGQIDQDVANIA